MKNFLPLALILVAFGSGTWRLEHLPLLWDEGWTLTVARTFVERGFYGRLLLGEPAPPGLEAAFPLTAAVALSFRIFGVGIWQGRWVGVVGLLIALALLYRLARQLFNRSIALGTLAVVLLLSPHLALHPLFLARLVLAEIPLLCFLLAGYFFFLRALQESEGWILPAIFFWGIALITKAQTLPFWLASLGLALSVALMRRHWRWVRDVSAALLGSFLVSRGLLAAQGVVLQGHTLPPTPIVGLYEVTAFVLEPAVRVNTLTTLLIVGVPLLLGLVSWHSKIFAVRDAAGLTRLALWGLGSSWLVWFAFFSVGWIRYLFPATFVGSIFVAATLCEWRTRRVTIFLLVIFVPVTIWQLARAYAVSDDSAVTTARWLNAHTAPNAIVESYESELFFLLERRYHYPPDQTNVALIRHSLPNGAATPYASDALAADPDYLVIGTVGREAGLYDHARASFRLIQTIGGYEIYARVR